MVNVVPHRRPAPSAGLRVRLEATIRPEFRRDVVVFDADDAVFGSDLCRIPECMRRATGHGLCSGHHLRWRHQGRPDLDSFAATTDPRWKRQRPNLECRFPGCHYGTARRGLCQLHAQRWARAGRPELEVWLTEPQDFPRPADGVLCLIEHCRLWPTPHSAFCRSHANTWKANGRPDEQAFATSFAEISTPSDQIIRLTALGGQMKLELQYVLQRRADDRCSKTPPAVVMRIVRFLAAADETSILQASERQWRERYSRAARRDATARALLAYAHRVLDDLAAGDGWEAEFDRDQWRLRRLGLADSNRILSFAQIPQPQFRLLAKRWARWRISSGLSYEAVRRAIAALTRFTSFLDAHAGVTVLAQLDRPLLERYLADLHAEFAGNPQRQGSHIGLLNRFFQAVRQHQWDTSLPSSVVFFSEDYPKRTERLPRALAEHVMAQVEHPDNLARFGDDAYRLITLILIRCGLRVTDALTLALDCLVTDADGAPYLRYVNHKMNRDALVPLDEQLVALIHQQQHQVTARWSGCRLLFPRPTKNLDGRLPLASSTYRLALYRWLAKCDVRDEHGRPVHFTPHQWRHTLGTRMINRDVPQEVVRRILDHDSSQMTAHYARLHDTTVRAHWERARKVDIHGDSVRLDPDGPLAEAAWAKHRLSRATQALPNGYCQLPVQQSCPHANACLTCPMFVTTPDFLPEHRRHRTEVLQIISAAQARGQQRLVEMNRQVLTNLDTIITSLSDKTPQDGTAHAG